MGGGGGPPPPPTAHPARMLGEGSCEGGRGSVQGSTGSNSEGRKSHFQDRTARTIQEHSTCSDPHTISGDGSLLCGSLSGWLGGASAWATLKPPLRNLPPPTLPRQRRGVRHQRQLPHHHQPAAGRRLLGVAAAARGVGDLRRAVHVQLGHVRAAELAAHLLLRLLQGAGEGCMMCVEVGVAGRLGRWQGGVRGGGRVSCVGGGGDWEARPAPALGPAARGRKSVADQRPPQPWRQCGRRPAWPASMHEVGGL